MVASDRNATAQTQLAMPFKRLVVVFECGLGDVEQCNLRSISNSVRDSCEMSKNKISREVGCI